MDAAECHSFVEPETEGVIRTMREQMMLRTGIPSVRNRDFRVTEDIRVPFPDPGASVSAVIP